MTRLLFAGLLAVGACALLLAIGWSHAELRGAAAAPVPVVVTAQPAPTADPGYISGDVARQMFRDLELHDERMAAMIAGVAVSGDAAQTGTTGMFLLAGLGVAVAMVVVLYFVGTRRGGQ